MTRKYYQKILVPFDGSDPSKNAIEEARMMQSIYPADITLLQVLPNPYADRGSIGYRMLNTPYGANAEAYEEAQAELSALKEGFAHPDQVSLLLVEGAVATAIVDVIEKGKYDLVIMGSEGLGQALKRFLLGSVTKYVLEHVDTPVLVLR
ncbi:universal stress protein [Peptococcus niger]|uniref:Nucleotide-binding universal stress protein, UspA family n=1 Tax=Peptococcus niger TaxID=2741 RepID=A0A1G6VF74_PEPNI|nr:universal stress protein [Peptococcus niger]SDD52174.1 Nucleotide-binding universal stress protein, UspA family [Peptococcus niger]